MATVAPGDNGPLLVSPSLPLLCKEAASEEEAAADDTDVGVRDGVVRTEAIEVCVTTTTELVRSGPEVGEVVIIEVTWTTDVGGGPEPVTTSVDSGSLEMMVSMLGELVGVGGIDGSEENRDVVGEASDESAEDVGVAESESGAGVEKGSDVGVANVGDGVEGSGVAMSVSVGRLEELGGRPGDRGGDAASSKVSGRPVAMNERLERGVGCFDKVNETYRLSFSRT